MKDNTNNEYKSNEVSLTDNVSDVEFEYGQLTIDFGETSDNAVLSNKGEQPANLISGLSPILKWPGGKEKELKYILPNVPKFKRYYEPFVGGGAVFMGLNADEYFINDLSSELIELYRNIASGDSQFFSFVEGMDKSWANCVSFFLDHPYLIDLYINYRNEFIVKEELKSSIHSFCMEYKEGIFNILDDCYRDMPSVLIKEIEVNLFRKMVRMRELERERHLLPEGDLLENIECAIKSALYMNFRYLYNDSNLTISNPKLHCALFFFMRNYAYSGMFRYSSKGEFNVPYGGIAYNNKRLEKKLAYYRSTQLSAHFQNTRIFNLDFEDFLKTTNPQEDDFVFLDPPYDSEFSTYAQNAFTRADQERLANYMINICPARWMMIIKNTDFIYSLYNKEGINIRTFDKEYLVSFMNRNDKKVTHLLITNY